MASGVSNPAAATWGAQSAGMPIASQGAQVWPAAEHLWPHLWEEQHLLNGPLVGQHHHQSVHADAHTAGGGHAVFQGAQEVLVDEHGLVVASRPQA